MLFHVEKTYIALHCQMCGTNFKNRQGITKQLQVMHKLFLHPCQTYQDFRYFLQNHKKYLRTLRTSIITTNGINFLIAGPLTTLSLGLSYTCLGAAFLGFLVKTKIKASATEVPAIVQLVLTRN